MKITKDELVTLLKQAQKAHHEYEQRNAEAGNKDGWAAWYASYIEEKLPILQEDDSNPEIDHEL